MHTRPIPSSGAALPVIGCGTWRGFDVGRRPEEKPARAEVLQALFDAGGSVVDSSPMYGTAEAVVGELLQAANTRQRAFVATKVWTSGRQAGVEQMERSMALLRTSRIDLMQVHNWSTRARTWRHCANGRRRGASRTSASRITPSPRSASSKQ
jgi:aryl-alcohol dehydrogenase-like predicted oxidoreductase